MTKRQAAGGTGLCLVFGADLPPGLLQSREEQSQRTDCSSSILSPRRDISTSFYARHPMQTWWHTEPGNSGGELVVSF